MQRVEGEESSVERAELRSLKRGEERALSCLGRLRVMRETPGRGWEIKMCSYVSEEVASELWKRREGSMRGRVEGVKREAYGRTVRRKVDIVFYVSYR